MLTRDALRKNIREKRQQLSAAEQQTAAEKLALVISGHVLFQQSAHIAAYIAHQGEINPAPLFARAWSAQKSIYLPLVRAEKQLCFVQYEKNDKLIKNCYGILEPIAHKEKILPPQMLDLVLMPLLAFDKQGHRLGMGAGYYDRTFAFLKNAGRPDKPFLLGLAYEWQKCENIAAQHWDVTLNAVATENGIYSFSID